MAIVVFYASILLDNNLIVLYLSLNCLDKYFFLSFDLRSAHAQTYPHLRLLAYGHMSKLSFRTLFSQCISSLTSVTATYNRHVETMDCVYVSTSINTDIFHGKQRV